MIVKESLVNYLILFVFLALIESRLCYYYKKNNINITKGFLIGWQLFAILMLAIFSVTGIPGIYEIIEYGGPIIRADEINLIPMNWRGAIPYGFKMNIILFIPIGIILPILWKSSMKFINTVCSGFLLSFLIEFSQLFNIRATDVDDLIANTMGTCIGYCLFYIIFRKIKWCQIENERNGKFIKYGAMSNIVLIFTVYFIVRQPILSFVWRIIYNF